MKLILTVEAPVLPVLQIWIVWMMLIVCVEIEMTSHVCEE